ncbi:MAG: DEAD/DEAH box helicase [Deltaproteobacteria bacterium]|nr:MAG: DEAD/DEAH box helicase [Deltaproteobacteria bacterium]
MPSIDQYISSELCQKMRESIADAQGNEVFFVGKPGESGKIEEIRVVCRGGPRSVMVLFSVPQYGDVVIHNHPSGHLLPSTADEEIAHKFDGKGVGFFIINNEVDEIYALVEPFREEAPATPLNEEEMVNILGPDGPLAKHLPGYEERQEQMDMLRHVVRSFNDEQVLLVEAGTGTGKSVAYLIPAIFWARRNRQRVLVSTNTINLQQQVFEKDIPFLQRVLGESFEAVLVKGRRNYLCQRKLHQNSDDLTLFPEEEREDVQYLIEWGNQTQTGDRAELSVMPRDAIWSTIATDADSCARNRCEYYRSCFYYMARRRQAKADVLITNHHILFADLALREATNNYHAAALLPPYQRVVMDEAHNVEDAASSFLGSQVTRRGVLRALGQLYRNRGRQESGLLIQLAGMLLHASNVQNKEKLRQTILETVLPTVRRQRQRAGWFAEQMHKALLGGENKEDTSTHKIRVTDALLERGPWDRLQSLGMDWSDELRGLVHELLRLGRNIDTATTRMARKFAGPLMDLEGATARLTGAAGTLELFFRPKTDDHPSERDDLVRWFEVSPSDTTRIKMQTAPLEIGEAMHDMMYDRFGGVVFTSATLATDSKDFSYFSGRLGIDRLEHGRSSSATFASPFDYSSQSLVGIPKDIPAPYDASFKMVITDVIMEALRISDGRAFVLCTSFQLLRYLHNELAPRLLEEMGIRSLKQGEAPRHTLLQEKINDPRSVLFGTDSFWEGVDVRGDALSNVILTRLPFRVPSEPLIEARVEAIEARGENPFVKYTVPSATIKFKQGFGRLIRSRMDRGTVLILDKRVVEKSYGKRFLNALPEACPRVVGSRQQVMEAFQAFHGSKSSN